MRIHEVLLRAFLKRLENSEADVDDIVQETFSRIIEIKKRKDIRSVRPLLFTIARNICYDRVRRKTASKTVSVGDVSSLNVYIDEDILPSESVMRNDDSALLKTAVDTLPDRCREVLMLRIYHGYSYNEIADTLGISRKTVENQLIKAVKRCKKYFAQSFHGPHLKIVK